MQFLKEIEAHLVNYESEVKDEIKKFIDHLWSKYPPVTDAVVLPPAPLTVSTPVPAAVTLVPVCAPAPEAPTVKIEAASTPDPEPVTVDIPTETPAEVTIVPAPTTCAPTETSAQ